MSSLDFISSSTHACPCSRSAFWHISLLGSIQHVTSLLTTFGETDVSIVTVSITVLASDSLALLVESGNKVVLGQHLPFTSRICASRVSYINTSYLCGISVPSTAATTTATSATVTATATSTSTSTSETSTTPTSTTATLQLVDLAFITLG